MALLEINWRPTNRDLRTFAMVQLIAAAIVAWWLHHRFAWSLMAAAIVGAATMLAIAGLVRPLLVKELFIAWTLAAFPVGWVMSHLLLAVAYYGVVTPIAVYLRWRGRDSLQLQSRPDVNSYWHVRAAQRDASGYFKQF